MAREVPADKSSVDRDASARTREVSPKLRLRPADLYIGCVIAAGTACLGYGLWRWQTQDWIRYLCYCAIALIVARIKVTLPAVAGTMSMNFVFVLIGIADLSLGETVAMGCLGMLVQSVCGAKERPKTVQVCFNVATLAGAALPAYQAYHAQFLKGYALEAPLLLLLAAGIFFSINTVSVALVIAFTESKHPWAVWRESFFWTFPNYLVGAAIAWTISEVSRLLGWQASLLLLPVLYVIYHSHSLSLKQLQEEKERAEEQRKHAQEVVALHRRTMRALALAVEAKDRTTHDHLRRVELYAVELGKELGLPDGELEALRTAALLHDIGKLAVPESIISKPGRLTPEEFDKMKVHTIVGGEIVEQACFPFAVAPLVRGHHEKWDGNGYPDGLTGEQIPLGARILSAVDCLDALASDRQYRRALPLEQAIEVVKSEAGKSFDPRVVQVLARRYREMEAMIQSGERPEGPRLSTDAKIERGVPAAGFQTAERPGEASRALLRLHQSIVAAERPARELCQDDATGSLPAFETLARLVPCDAIALYVRDGERLVLERVHGEDYRRFAALEIPVGTGLSGWVAENRKSIINGNPAVEPGYLSDPAKFSTLRSALSIPLEGNSGVVGVLSLYRQDPDAFAAEHHGQLLAFAPELARAIEDRMAARDGAPLEQHP